jgi:hypothetical protein
MSKAAPNTNRMIAAGFLTWVLPGAGHYYLGHRKFAAVFCGAIMLPFLAGVAIGGVKTSINPHVNKWLFLAEMGAGGPTGAFFAVGNSVGGIDARTTAAVIQSDSPMSAQQRSALGARLAPYRSYYPGSDIAQIYLAVAGLLNLLAILDAMTRAQTGGMPVYYHELGADGERAA